jgi:enoyl-CoA hydratase/carnithine racemase
VEQVAYVVSDNVATVTLNRPGQLNAFTLRMCADLLAAFDRVDADDDVRAVVVTGAGRAFCAGADLGAGGGTFNMDDVASLSGAADLDIAADPSGGTVPRDAGGLVTLRIFDCTKPVIAAINGAAVGFGLTATLPMDIRLVAEGAKLGFVFNRRGILPDAASSWFLPRVVGISQAMEWTATGRIFGPEEALHARLVRSVHPADELLPAAYALAREIADNAAPVSVALTRRLMWRMLGADHPMHAHRAESRGLYERGRSADAVEGVTSVLEKRPPHFPLRVSRDLPDVQPGWEAPGF